jgi:hypothetical protein
MAKALAYSVFLRPSLYAVPGHLPGLGLGQTVFRTDFPLERPSRPLVALALVMSRSLDSFTQARVATARALSRGLASLAQVRVNAPVAGATPVYLRLPLMIEDEVARARAFDALRKIGIGATGSYPASIADVPELRPHFAGTPDAGNGRVVARRIMTLPTHPYVTGADVTRTIDALSASLAAASLDVRQIPTGTEKNATCVE